MKDIDEQIDHSAEIIAALSRLTDRQKIAVLAVMLGYTQAEMGDILGVSQPTASVILKSSKAALENIRK